MSVTIQNTGAKWLEVQGKPCYRKKLCFFKVQQTKKKNTRNNHLILVVTNIYVSCKYLQFSVTKKYQYLIFNATIVVCDLIVPFYIWESESHRIWTGSSRARRNDKLRNKNWCQWQLSSKTSTFQVNYINYVKVNIKSNY